MLRAAALGLVLLAMLLPSPAFAVGEPMHLTTGWEYRWGDSPFDEAGIPLWTQSPEQDDQWQAIGFPSNPPGRARQQNAWFRTTLPAGEWRDPILYIFSVDLITEVYMDGERIYHYGTFTPEGGGRFEGWPWHMISLPPDYAGKQIYFRIWSNYSDIGLWGEVKIMDRPDFYLYILEQSLDRLVVSGFSLLIALLALIFALVQENRRLFGSVGLFSLASGLMILSESQTAQLIMHAPLAWDFITAGSYYMLPVAMALLFEHWFGDRFRLIIRGLWHFHLAYVVGALSLSALGIINLSSTFPVFDMLFVITLSILTVIVVARFRAVDALQRRAAIAFGIFGALLIIDMAVAHGFLSWRRVPVTWGVLGFSVLVVTIAFRQYYDTQKALRQLNLSLESKVYERTAALEKLADRERLRAKALAFENLKASILNDIVSELQDAPSYTTAISVLCHRLPELCSPIPGAFFQLEDDGKFHRLALWGIDLDNNDHLVFLPTVFDEAPEASSPPSLSRGTVANEQWHFPLSIQHAGRGSSIEGVLTLLISEVPAVDIQAFTTNRLFHNIKRAIEKITVTLSGTRLMEEFQQLSYEDSLTGLKNRRLFDELMAHHGGVAQRMNSDLSVLIADIDHFKTFNDTWGHEAGDEALRQVAFALHDSFRDTDAVCRFGGEEFVIIMPGADVYHACERAEDARQRISHIKILHGGRNLGGVTISFGVASWPRTQGTPKDLLALADKALYLAKQHGRNRVEVAEPSAPAVDTP